MILVRSLFAIAFILLGALVVVRVLPFLPHAGFRILPGLILGLAMIALGAYRIAQVRKMRGW